MTGAKMPCGPEARALVPCDYIQGYNDGSKVKRAVVLRRDVVDGMKMEDRVCKNCGGVFTCPAAIRKDYGDTPCRMEFLKRRQRRGLFVIDDVLRWRGDRKDPTALADLCAKISLLLDQDRALGRPSW